MKGLKKVILVLISLIFITSEIHAQPEMLYYETLKIYRDLAKGIKPSENDIKKLIESVKKRNKEDGYLVAIEILNEIGELDKAIKLVEEAIDRFPNNSVLATYKGEFLLRKGFIEDSIYWFKRALQLDKKNRFAYLDLIQVYLNTKKFDEAFNLIKEAENEFPSDSELLLLKGKAYYLIELYKNAELALEKSIEINPNNIEALRLLAEVYVLNGRLKKASKLYEQLMKSGIISMDLVIKLIRIYMATEQYDKALSFAERIYSVHPDEEIKNILAFIYLKTGQTEKAKELLKSEPDFTPLIIGLLCKENKLEKAKHASEIYLNTLEDLKNLLSLIYDLGTFKCADEIVKVGAKKFYNKDEFYYIIGRFYLEVENYELSEAFAKSAISLNDKNATYWFLLGSIKEKQEDFKNAINYLSKAIELESDNPTMLNYYGYTLIAGNIDIDKGIALVKKALEKDPENSAYLDSLAWGYYKKGNLKEALEIQEKVYSKEEDNAVIVYHLAEIYYSINNKDKALELFKKVRELLPKAKDISTWERREIEKRLFLLNL